MFKKIFAIIIATILLLSFINIYKGYLYDNLNPIADNEYILTKNMVPFKSTDYLNADFETPTNFKDKIALYIANSIMKIYSTSDTPYNNAVKDNSDYINRHKIPYDIAFLSYLIFLFYVFTIKSNGENYKFIILTITTAAMIFAHIHCFELLKAKHDTDYKGILQKQGYTTEEKTYTEYVSNFNYTYDVTYTALINPNGNEVFPKQDILDLSGPGGITIAKDTFYPYLNTFYDHNLNILYKDDIHKYLDTYLYESIKYDIDYYKELEIPYICVYKTCQLLEPCGYSMMSIHENLSPVKTDETKYYFVLADGKELDSIDKYLKIQMIPFVVITIVYILILALCDKIQLFFKKVFQKSV